MIRLIFSVLFLGLALGLPGSEKIDKSLKNVLHWEGQANVVISFIEILHGTGITFNIDEFKLREDKITAWRTQLQRVQQESQQNALKLLQGTGLTYHSLWINNRIYIEKADARIINEIAQLKEVLEIREEQVAYRERSIVEENGPERDFPEWGIVKIQADEVWILPGGNNGAGVVVATIDSGVRGTHQTLANNKRTNYSWFDPYTYSARPFDLNGPGTHVMGTIVGAGGIGVAPGAQWISCRGCSGFECSESSLSRCGQWIACPTLEDGVERPLCSMAPNVVVSSWGTAQGATWFDTIIGAWKTIGIIPVFAGGSGGPTCGNVAYPASHPDVISVGATTNSDKISERSSRGPTQDERVKPDLSAPGVDVRSAWNETDLAYYTISGSSCAAAHVAGAAALLLSNDPRLTSPQIRTLLEINTDKDLGEAETCGGTSYDEFPNNIYGFGRVNALEAIGAIGNNKHFK